MLKRLVELDSLRGIAALCVVLFHFTYGYQKFISHFEIPALLTFRFGFYGVYLFFVLSGFVIYYSITNIRSGKEFIIKRAIRLYPTYWICLITTFIFVYSINNLPESFSVSYKQAFIGLTMLQQLFYTPPIDKSYWTLVPEFFFYFCVFLLIITRTEKNILIIGLIWLLFSFIHEHIYHIKYFGLILNLKYAPFFYAGIIFYHIMAGSTKKGFLYFQLFLCFSLSVSIFNDPLKDGIAVLVIYLLFLLFITKNLGFLNYRPLIFLGQISYAWYLLHQSIGYVIMKLMQDYIDSIFLIFFPIAITLGLATIITFYAERPVMKYLKKKLLSSNASEPKISTLP